MQDKNVIKLTDQDAALLEQGASMLEGLENDERNRGNCSTAEGAGCSAHAVRRLASALLTHEREIGQCLHQIQEPEADIWPCVNIDVDDSGKITNAKLYSPGLPAGNHDVYPVRVPYMDEHTEAWRACVDELEKAVPGFMSLGNMNGIECAVAAIRGLSERAKHEPAAAEQAAWHAGLDEGRAQATGSVSNATSQAAPAAVAVPGAAIAGALFDFCGYLTTLPRQQAITASEAHEASPMVEALEQWSTKRNLPLDDADVKGWCAALAATPAADATAQTIERQRMTAGRASFFMERFLREEKLLGPNEQAALHFVIDILEAAAAPVVLPELDVAVREVMGMVAAYGLAVAANSTWKPQNSTLAHSETAAYNAIKPKLRALLAGVSAPAAQAEPVAWPHVEIGLVALEWKRQKRLFPVLSKDGWMDQALNNLRLAHTSATPQAKADAQAVERGEVLVTVSGFTGSGKSAIAGEIEIMCRALGLQVEWPDGDSEKNMTHADWTAALELYKPRVRIVENNIPRASKEGPTA